MYNKSGTRNKIIRYLVSNDFILDSGNTLLTKSQYVYYYKFPVAVTIFNDDVINIKDISNNRRYVFDNDQSILTITHFIKYLDVSQKTISS